MKKIVIWLLIFALFLPICPKIYALDSVNSSQGTQVVYKSTGTEEYLITVPSRLYTGEDSIVVLKGTWPSNRVIVVETDPFVKLINETKKTEYKIAKINFSNISGVGNNTIPQRYEENISVGAAEEVFFGIWRGCFNYNVEISTIGPVYSMIEKSTGIEQTIEDGCRIPCYTVRSNFSEKTDKIFAENEHFAQSTYKITAHTALTSTIYTETLPMFFIDSEFLGEPISKLTNYKLITTENDEKDILDLSIINMEISPGVFLDIPCAAYYKGTDSTQPSMAPLYVYDTATKTFVLTNPNTVITTQTKLFIDYNMQLSYMLLDSLSESTE